MSEHEHTWMAHIERCACGAIREAPHEATVAAHVTIQGADVVASQDIVEGDTVSVSPDALPYLEPGAPPCTDPRGHAFELLRTTLAHTIERCPRCNTKRYRTAESAWSYGEPPKPPPARRMKEDEDLAPGETWEDADGHVPREISTPQPRVERVVNGRRVFSDEG